MSGTSYRLPRKVKKAQTAFYAKAATPKQLRLLKRCLVIGGWKTVRKHNAHVAMGDTTTARWREQRERAVATFNRLFHRS